MGLLASAVAERGQRNNAAFAETFWPELMGGRSSKAGPHINLDNALKVATAFACIRVLSQGCAQVPFKLFRESEVDGLTKIMPAKEHGLYDLVTVKPSEFCTSFEFRESLVMHASLGNAYVFKNIVRGTIRELILFQPAHVEKVFAEDYRSFFYRVTSKSGSVKEFPADAIWHIKGPSWDGCLGLDILNLAREALGLSIATEETHSKLHAKGVRPSGTYSVDGTLSKDQHRDLKKWIDAEFAGPQNSGSPMILDRSAKWLSQSMTGIDAQHLETRRFQIEEVCRFFGVFPTMIFSTDKTSTFASAAAFFEAHVRYSLSPWFARVEQSADAYLLSKEERKSGHYFKFMAGGLLRGSAKDRSEYYTKALGSGGHPGWMSPDEVRALEEMNPMGGEAAKLPPGSSSAVVGGEKPADTEEPPVIENRN